LDTITFKHQDRDMTFSVAHALFATDGRSLTLSIRCEGNPAFSWMSSPSFCLVDVPLDGPLRAGATLTFDGSDEDADDGPRSFAYAGEHTNPRDVQIKVLGATGDEMLADIAWSQSDPDYYDERAKPTRVEGRCTLKRGPVDQMWIPV
jgi:hypothetical protein